MQSRKISRTTLKTLLMGSSLLVVVSAGNSAFAQDSADSSVEAVVVTGSRIVRRDFTAVSPIVTVNSQTFESRAGPEIEATLNQLPQFQAGINNQIGQAGAGQQSATQTPGASALNLRGLGPNRNLVLLDGRRAQPANAALWVDINSIPSSAIEGVEIISGGASAVYGADAIAGVVNFKLKKNFQGLELDAQYGITEKGDNKQPNISALIGGNFADNKGNALFGASYTSRSDVKQKDREFYRAAWYDPTTNSGQNYPFLPLPGYDCGGNATFVGLSPANCPSAAVVTSIFGAGVVPAGNSGYGVNLNGTIFLPTRGANGVGAPRYSGSLAPNYKIENSGALGVEDPQDILSPAMTRWATFATAHYDITPHMTAFLQGNFSESKIRTEFGASPAVQFWGAPVPHDAAHPTTPELEALLNSRPDPNAPWALQIRTDSILGRRSGQDTTNTYQIMAGLRGDIANTDWTWEVYGSHGKTNFVSVNDTGYGSTERWKAFLALPNYGANGTIARGSLQTATCTSGFYNAIFKGTRPSEDCVAAVTIKMQSTQQLSQDIVEATLQGGLFELPAGQLRFAVGADYRENRFEFIADPLLDVLSISDAPIGLFPTASTKGAINVKEVYGELLVPVLKDLPMVQAFNLELGLRYSDYSTAGGSITYKIAGDWKVNQFVTLRGGYQKAQRAPNIAELYQPGSPLVVGASAGDPCAVNTPATWGNNAANPNRAKVQALCAALIAKFDPSFVYNGANYQGLFPFFFPLTIDLQQGTPDLDPEKAKTFTAGAVLRSPIESGIFSRLTASVDWYDIKIRDAIIPLTSQTLYEQCFNADGASNTAYTIAGNQFCSFINREKVTGGNRNARAPFFNFGSLRSSGIDAQVDWTTNAPSLFSDPATFSLNFVMNYQLKYTVQTSPTGKINNYAGYVNGGAGSGNQFRYRIFTTANYRAGPMAMGLRWRHFPSAKDASLVVNPTSTLKGVSSHNEFDLFGSWTLSRALSLRAGVDNLLNTKPEVSGVNTSTTAANSNLGTTLFDYDVLGRRFYVGLKARF
jgi:outer membrane receptor protein involved in Fe transport